LCTGGGAGGDDEESNENVHIEEVEGEEDEEAIPAATMKTIAAAALSFSSTPKIVLLFSTFNLLH
jgi:hypothetical protein